MNSIQTGAHAPLEATVPPHGVGVLESHHARDFRAETTSHPFHQLLFAVRGSGTLRLETRSYSLQSGDLALVPAGARHQIEDQNGAPISIYIVNLAPRLALEFPAFGALFESPKRLRLDVVRALMPDLLRRLLLEQTLQKAGYEAMMRGLALQLLTLLARGSESAPLPIAPRVAASYARVHAYVGELERSFYRAQSVDSVAASLGLSRRRFTALFREIAGDSWLCHLRRLRIEHAKLLLANADRTVLAVAFECGYEDVSSFYRAFKSVSGQTPDSWRKHNSQ